MGSEVKGEDDRSVATEPSSGGYFGKSIVDQYTRLKENAEAYPYVWGSYIIVYGGFGLWMGYRWRRLRKTEDRVRVLQGRLQKLIDAEKNPASKASSDANKPLK